MQCGNCKQGHTTVQQVKDCYGVAGKVKIFAATKSQIDFLDKLRTRLEMTRFPGDVELSKSEASSEISRLLVLERTQDSARSVDSGSEEYGDAGKVLFTDGEDFVITKAPKQDANSNPSRVWNGPSISHEPGEFERARQSSPWCGVWRIPSGYYAIPSLSGTNDLDFYRVKRPIVGKWTGYTFVDMVIGGKPDRDVRGKQRMYDILSAIEKDPAQAAYRYGQEMGRCDKCNIHLTDKVSREHSRGPDCRKKYGPGFMAA